MCYKKLIPTVIVVLISAIIISEYVQEIFPFLFGIFIGLLLTVVDFITGFKLWQDFMEWFDEVTD